MSTRTSGGRVTEITKDVTAVADKGGRLLVTVRQTETGVRDHVYQYAVSVTGVSLAALDEEAFDPPVPLLRLPARAGDTWDRQRAAPGAPPATFTYTVGKEAEVGAEGGKVRAVPVERVVTGGGKVVSRLTYWYAPGRGQVRLEGNTGAEDYTKVRKSFSAAKH